MATLVEKLVAVMKAVDHVEKSGRNSFQNYNYVKATDMMRAVRDELIKQNVLMTTEVMEEERWQEVKPPKKEGAEPSIMYYCRLHMGYTFRDAESAEQLGPFKGTGWGSDKGDKAPYKAMTGALKYVMRNTFLIPDESDPENETEHKERKTKTQTLSGIVEEFKASFNEQVGEEWMWVKISGQRCLVKDAAMQDDFRTWGTNAVVEVVGLELTTNNGTDYLELRAAGRLKDEEPVKRTEAAEQKPPSSKSKAKVKPEEKLIITDEDVSLVSKLKESLAITQAAKANGTKPNFRREEPEMSVCSTHGPFPADQNCPGCEA